MPRAAPYSALRAFLNGYLHEDFASEHATLRNAIADFKQHADWDATALVAHQLHKFITEHQGEPIEDVNEVLSRLGCAYEFLNWDELLDFEKLLYS